MTALVNLVNQHGVGMLNTIAPSIKLQIHAVRNTALRGVRGILHLLGAEITSYEPNQEVTKLKGMFGGLVDLATRAKAKAQSDETKFLLFAQEHLHVSQSQILQDLFVLYELQGKRNGYFVEFGATNGVDSNNSFVLEKHYGWSGILAEPGKVWHAQLRANRKSVIDTRCVWNETGRRLEFNEVQEPELSTINTYSHTDRYRESRARGSKYEVETVSLNELLRTHGAPKQIDYLSIDTEGSEYDILSKFDFDKYDIQVITCEHNYTEARGKIFELLSAKGYLRKFELFSQVDDWYVRST